jgi:hypothetical protein
MICGGGGDEGSGKEAGGNDFWMMQIIASYNHGGCSRHTATMGPHSQQQSIQQSTNIICDGK